MTLYFSLLTVKSPSWKYEQEARIVAYKAENIRIPQDFISKITFGINAAADDIYLIKEITRTYNPSIKLYRAIKGSKEFAIEFTEIV